MKLNYLAPDTLLMTAEFPAICASVYVEDTDDGWTDELEWND